MDVDRRQGSASGALRLPRLDATATRREILVALMATGARGVLILEDDGEAHFIARTEVRRERRRRPAV